MQIFYTQAGLDKALFKGDRLLFYVSVVVEITPIIIGAALKWGFYGRFTPSCYNPGH